MTDQGTKDLLARGNVFGGRADAGFVPAPTVPRDYNANITGQGNGAYSDPYSQYQQVRVICLIRVRNHAKKLITGKS